MVGVCDWNEGYGGWEFGKDKRGEAEFFGLMENLLFGCG